MFGVRTSFLNGHVAQVAEPLLVVSLTGVEKKAPARQISTCHVQGNVLLCSSNEATSGTASELGSPPDQAGNHPLPSSQSCCPRHRPEAGRCAHGGKRCSWVFQVLMASSIPHPPEMWHFRFALCIEAVLAASTWPFPPQ